MLYSGETSTNRMSFRRNTESRFSRETKSNFAALTKSGERGHVASYSVAAAFRRALFREKATYCGETSTNRMSFRRNTESRFSREAKANMFRMISLQQIAMQLPWNDILAKIVGGGGGDLEFYFKFSKDVMGCGGGTLLGMHLRTGQIGTNV